MLSPYPGMNPWLEDYLRADLHHELASSIRKQLASQVKPKYVVRIDTYAFQDVYNFLLCQSGRIIL